MIILLFLFEANDETRFFIQSIMQVRQFENQVNNTTTKNKLLVVVHVVDKFKSYLMGAKAIVHIIEAFVTKERC